MAKKEKTATATMDFEDMLASNETTASSAKKKDDSGAFQLPEDLQQAFLNFLTHKKNKVNEETLMREEEEKVLEFCKNRFDSDGLAGKFTHSYDVKAKDAKAKFITTDKFSIGQDNDIINKAKDLLGKDYEEVIGIEKVVTMNPEVFENEALKKEFVELLGDKFSKFFTTTKRFVVKKGFNEKIFKIAGNKEKLTQIREIIVPTKPSLK